jgi:hypothetical protein
MKRESGIGEFLSYFSTTEGASNSFCFLLGLQTCLAATGQHGLDQHNIPRLVRAFISRQSQLYALATFNSIVFSYITPSSEDEVKSAISDRTSEAMTSLAMGFIIGLGIVVLKGFINPYEPDRPGNVVQQPVAGQNRRLQERH